MVYNFRAHCFIFILSMLMYIQPNSSDILVKRMYKEGYFKDVVRRKPILMVPGVLGSQLQAKLNRKHSAWWLCSKISDWFDIWLNIKELTPLSIDCWVDDIRLRYNNKTGGIQNQEGVEVRTHHFGSTEAFEYLDKDEYAPGSPYFNKLVDAMVKLGYKKGDDLKGAPFDWRLTPSISSLFLTNVTRLIEENYYQHNNQKVVIIGHSMGNLFIHYMLKKLPQSWKDKFIDSFISINAPYIGSVKALKAITSGESEGHDILLPERKLRTMARTLPSSYFMLPRPEFWPKNKHVVVDTFSKNYTVNDYKQLFKRIGCKNCWELWKEFGRELGDLAAPNVEVHCVYSSQVPTAEVLIYDPDLFPDGTPVLVTGDGDGTVNTFSSSYCLNWRGEQNQYVHDVLLPGNDHVKMLNNVTLHNYITKVVTSGFK